MTTEEKNGWDKVYWAYCSGDLKKMLSVTKLETRASNRHFLLQSIIRDTYKLRSDEYYQQLCLKFGEIYFEEYPVFEVKLREHFKEDLPRITAFEHYATLLTELGEYEKAITVCKMAISFNLNDGTKSNYQGRIDRIKKK